MDGFLGISETKWLIFFVIIGIYFAFRSVERSLENLRNRVANLEEKINIIENPHLRDDDF